MTQELKQNPYQWAGSWYFYDEQGRSHGRYETQAAALYALLRHILPPWYTRWWGNLKNFWKDIAS